MTSGTQTYAQAHGVSSEREKDDYYPTPANGTRALLAVERFDGDVWECACGEGDMSRVMEAAGYRVVSTDLIDRGYGEARVDFLMEQRALAPNIVTNPPFKLAEPFARHALRLTEGRKGAKVALLCRLAWLEGKGRRDLFENTPLARVWVFAGRINIQRGKLATTETAGMVAFAWFVWEHGHEGPASIGWISPDVEGVEP